MPVCVTSICLKVHLPLELKADNTCLFYHGASDIDEFHKLIYILRLHLGAQFLKKSFHPLCPSFFLKELKETLLQGDNVYRAAVDRYAHILAQGPQTALPVTNSTGFWISKSYYPVDVQPLQRWNWE